MDENMQLGLFRNLLLQGNLDEETIDLILNELKTLYTLERNIHKTTNYIDIEVDRLSSQDSSSYNNGYIKGLRDARYRLSGF